ncbi:hypothetical protein [Actinoplanes derwentensis]|uniref:Transmembrane protein n=1 Tax=Actinoplanes derwentensis TaxID=113562 RepID=A0A1H1YCU5_9ACTN|nr:hypothetical protein [Actinoplanes derwentensis]GID81092.1 hypothetical protein Ade03nite_00160 [Actinoplanes derwentensis]SDT19201.1 hypothetical protein SAMN04489716_2801 [Actinoplanes derwentensis]
MSTEPIYATPTPSSWLPRSGKATTVLVAGLLTVTVPVLYFLLTALATIVCFGSECDDSDVLWAPPAVLVAVLMAVSPFAAVNFAQRGPSAPTAARTALTIAGHIVIVWAVTGAVMAYSFATTGIL